MNDNSKRFTGDVITLATDINEMQGGIYIANLDKVDF